MAEDMLMEEAADWVSDYEYDVATAACEKSLSFEESTAELLVELELFEDAIGYYTKAIELRSVHMDTWELCTYALLQVGKKEEARAFFEMVKASAAVRELKWADKLHKSAQTAAFGGM